jgi:hypothetical protein
MMTLTVEMTTVRRSTRGMIQNSRKKEESKESKEFEELQEFRSANAISGVAVPVAHSLGGGAG